MPERCRDLVRKLRPDLLDAYDSLNRRLSSAKREVLERHTSGLLKDLDQEEAEVLQILCEHFREELKIRLK
jgi:hypothetical protein